MKRNCPEQIGMFKQSSKLFFQNENSILKHEEIHPKNSVMFENKMLLNENASDAGWKKRKNEKKSFAFYAKNAPFNDSKSLDESKKNFQKNATVSSADLRLSLDDENGFRIFNQNIKKPSGTPQIKMSIDWEPPRMSKHVSSGSSWLMPTINSFKKFQPDKELINFNATEGIRQEFSDPAKSKFDHPFLANSSFTDKYLGNMRTFLFTVFTYQPICVDDIQSLSPGEKKILTNIINGKDYVFKRRLAESLYSPRPELSLWDNFYKTKRKEEHLKYGLKILFRHLQSQIAQLRPASSRPDWADPLSTQLHFYVHYFGHLKFSMNMDQLIEIIDNRFVTRKKIWNNLSEFILPEMGFQSNFSSVRSINQTYLRSICSSSRFVRVALPALLDSAIFMGYCRDQAWEQRPIQEGPMEAVGVKFLKTVGKTNKSQINKLFKEWENQLIRKETFVDTGSPLSIKRSFEVIKAGAKRKNLKFPWTFTEMHNALIESLLALLPFTHPKIAKDGEVLSVRTN